MLQTVTGKVSTSGLGAVLMHEHIMCASNDMLHAFKDKWLDREALIKHASKILRSLKEKYNVGLVVDGTPIDLGRDVKVLKEVSMRSGVKIIASTGLYIYPSMITSSRDENELAQWFLQECECGMEGTDIKPGILKCAAFDSECNSKRIAAMGIVQKKTGMPIYLHCYNKNVDEALRILESVGADKSKIIVGHIGGWGDFKYAKTILEKGYSICLDQCFCYPQRASQVVKELIAWCEKGFADKITVSNDVCIYSDFATKQTAWLMQDKLPETLGFSFEYIYPEFIRHGGNDALWNKMMCENPIKILK